MSGVEGVRGGGEKKSKVGKGRFAEGPLARKKRGRFHGRIHGQGESRALGGGGNFQASLVNKPRDAGSGGGATSEIRGEVKGIHGGEGHGCRCISPTTRGRR